MQSPTIMAFRKRLSNRGYTDISIKREMSYHLQSFFYLVIAREPLSNSFVRCKLTISDMDKKFR